MEKVRMLFYLKLIKAYDPGAVITWEKSYCTSLFQYGKKTL